MLLRENGQRNCSRSCGLKDVCRSRQPGRHLTSSPMEQSNDPSGVGEPTLRRRPQSMELNDESLAVNLDLTNELRDKARIREEVGKVRAARRYNTKVQPRSFRLRDLVWRLWSDARKHEGKFLANWERPFRIQT